MGICGLFSYIKDNKAYDIVNLVKVAEINDEIEILVDFNAYGRELIKLVLERMGREYDNDFLLFFGGEFDILFQVFYDFVKIFENIGIKLVWIVSEPKKLSKDSINQEMCIWMGQDNKDIRLMEKRPDGLNYLISLFLSYEISIASLKKAGAEIIQLLHIESHEYIAYEFHRRKSYAILTNDTDFLLFPDCTVIFPRLMKIPYDNEDLNLPFFDYKNPGNLLKSPESFECPIVKQQHIMDLLQFQNPDQLVVLSILKGNYNPSRFCQELQYSLKLTKSPTKYAHIIRITQFIRDHQITMENILEFYPIKTFGNQCPQLTKTINYCKEFYSLERIEENIRNMKMTFKTDTFDNPLTDYLAKKLPTIKLSKEIYSNNFGTTNDSIYPEEPNPNCKPITIIMSAMDSKIYSHRNENLDNVIECGSCSTSFTVSEEDVNIKTSQIHSNISITDWSGNKFDLFEEIWSHMEPSGCLHYIKKFGLDCGFICYILRYFYRITKNMNLGVSLDEFRALFISVFYNYFLWKGTEITTELKRESFLRLKFCPTPKCLFINTWFLRLFYTAKYLCGGAINLTEEFPSIKNIYNGSVFFTFYETAINVSNGGTSHNDIDLQKLIVELDLQIMEKNKQMYLDITDESTLFLKHESE